MKDNIHTRIFHEIEREGFKRLTDGIHRAGFLGLNKAGEIFTKHLQDCPPGSTVGDLMDKADKTGAQPTI